MKKCMTIFTIILICSIISDRKKWWVHMKVIIYRSKLTNSLIWTLHFCLPFTIKHSSNCNKSYAKRYDQKNRDIIYSHHSFDGKEKRTRDIKTDKNSREMLSAYKLCPKKYFNTELYLIFSFFLFVFIILVFFTCLVVLQEKINFSLNVISLNDHFYTLLYS